MKVLHIVDSFSPLSETFIYDYIIELERQGVNNHVLTFNRMNEQYRPFSKVHIAKIKKDFIWFVLRVIAEFNKKRNKWWAMQRREIKRIIKKVKPDIIHAHFGPTGVLVTPIAKKLNIPLIVSFHGYDASMLLQDSFWIKKYTTLNTFTKYVTVISKDMISRLTMFDSAKVKIIHVGKRLVVYPFNPNVKTIKNILSVGRLAEKKGFFDLINAFGLVIQEYPNINLQIVGDGPLKNDLQNLIEEKNLGNNINLLGSIKHSDVISYYKNSDAFILTSKTASNMDMEGIPTVLMEAQAFGKPVISTMHSGIPECIPIENHKFLAEEGNVEQIKDCIIRLINTDSSELIKVVERGRKKVEEEFNLEKEVKKLIELYNGINNDAK